MERTMFFTQFGLLFTNMEWYVAVCFVVGIACLIVEVFQPGFGVFGISGIVLLVLSIILRAVFNQEGDVVVMQIFQFVLLDVIIIGVLFLFLFIAHKLGWLKKSPIFHVGTAVDETFSDGTVDYSFLLGKEGETVTVMRPSGKIKIEGVIYDAESEEFLIEGNTPIVVSNFTDGIIKVKKVQK